MRPQTETGYLPSRAFAKRAIKYCIFLPEDYVYCSARDYYEGKNVGLKEFEFLDG